MRKTASFLLILIFLFCLCGCQNANQEKVSSSVLSEKDEYYNAFENFESSFINVRVKDVNYIIKSSKDYAGDFYEIYDNYGNLLDKGFHGWRGSFDISKEDNIVTLEYGFGGTNVFPKYRLYDIEKSKVSRYYEGPIAVKDKLVAYFSANEDDASLVVQDIFDIDKNYHEFNGEFDKSIFMKIQEIYFVDNGKKIIIKYCEANNENNIIEETFILE